MCRPLAGCAFAKHLKGTEERTEDFLVLSFGTVYHKKKMCLPQSPGYFHIHSWALSLCLKVIWLFHKCLLLHNSQRKFLLLEKQQHLLDRHTTTSQTCSTLFTATEGRASRPFTEQTLFTCLLLEVQLHLSDFHFKEMQCSAHP